MNKNFKGDTYVAFIDISGFKKLMEEEEKQASKALDSLYNHAYKTLKEYNHIYGVFVSDSGIIYVDSKKIVDKIESLKNLLKVLKIINKEVLMDGFILTCSIAYGKFQYKQKIVFSQIEKNAILGNAYLEAFSDNEYGKPKIKPGQCRLLISNELIQEVEANKDDEILRFLKEENNHYYFYWMIEDPSRIEEIENGYEKAYEKRYNLIKKVLKLEKL